MKYHKLDLLDFCDDKYSNLNHNEGIGGVGIITENQIINVYTDIALDEKTKKEYKGLGEHDVIIRELLKDMYGEHKYYDQFLFELIHIHYWNEPFRKRFAIFLPKELTEKEFNNLLFLEKYYDKIFHKYEIEIGGFLFGDNFREDKPRVETYSELEPFIDYASTLVNKSLTRKYKDKKIII